MAYVKQSWVNGVIGNTPLSAARMAHIEDGIFDAYAPNATDSLPGLSKLTHGFGGTWDRPTTPMVGQVAGGTMAAQGKWVAPGHTPSATQLVDGVTGGQVTHVGRGCTIDRLAVNITVAGSSGSVIRLGVYEITYNTVGAPVAALLYDAGTVSGLAIATVELTLAVPLVVLAGTNLWLTATGQGTPSTQPTITTGKQGGIGLPAATAAAALGNLGGIQATGNPTALPTSPTIATVVADAPRIAFRTSA